ncbi:protein phosphatase 2C domain-containing protein [Thiococcus pfennigii]|uniref:protein phosphatase 2C domain-containing protein n=1 Tax=Thiococcus pfennigii TaxID=1057 RepID=UPI0019058B2B|nr:protein phosphatase 2C domain-containing protein [Thiococcus pfennigii]MBK1733146.1 hypothetical protein [Thiococcus pfennigii]
MDEDQRLAIARTLAEEALRLVADGGEAAGAPLARPGDPAGLSCESPLLRAASSLVAEARALASAEAPADPDPSGEADDPPPPVADDDPGTDGPRETAPASLPSVEAEPGPPSGDSTNAPGAADTLPPAEPAERVAPDPAAPSAAPLEPDPLASPDGPTERPPEPPVARVAFAVNANARVDEPFEARLVVRSTEEAAIEILGCDLPDGLGLVFEAAGATLVGTPMRAGDFPLTVHYRFADGHADRPALAATARLTVNPDPRSLWQDRPSDADASGWKPDTDQALVATADGRRIVAASKRGRSHAHIGGFRDDDFCLLVDEARPWTLIAVADGAGSAERARIGSRLAAHTAAQRAAAHLAGGLGERLVERAAARAGDAAAQRAARETAYEVLGGAALAAVKAIEEAAERDGATAKDYATTLLLAGHRRLGDGHLVIAFWVGDGAIAVLEPDRVQLLGKPDGGAFAGQTRFLDRSIVGDANEIMARIRVATASDLQALLVMTDGVSDAHFASDRDLAEPDCWQAFWQRIAPLLAGDHPDETLLGWLDFWSPGNHDDRTIAVLW